MTAVLPGNSNAIPDGATKNLPPILIRHPRGWKVLIEGVDMRRLPRVVGHVPDPNGVPPAEESLHVEGVGV